MHIDSQAIGAGYCNYRKTPFELHILPPKPHFNLRKVIQCSQENLVVDTLVVGQMAKVYVSTAQHKLIWTDLQDLCQSQLPRRVTL